MKGRSRQGKERWSAARLKRLAGAVQARSAQPTRELTHAECEELLEFVVDDQRQGKDVRTLYPAAFHHLDACPRCRASFDLLHDALAADTEAAANAESPRAQPSPEASERDRLGWTQQVRARLGGEPLGFAFTLQPAYLSKILSARPLELRERAPSAARARQLILSDNVRLGRREIAVELWARPLPDSSQVQLEISVASSVQFDHPLTVSISWDGHRLSAPIENGQATLPLLAAGELEAAKDLRIAFEEEGAGA